MSAILVAVFNEYRAATRVRIELVRNGFPTDRVELTAGCEPGRAGLEPGNSMHERVFRYFGMLFTFEEEAEQAKQLAECVCNGAATITVHPRGAMEISRATRILAGASPLQLLSHDLPDQTLKYAAAHEREGRNGLAGSCEQRNGKADLLMGVLALCLLITGYLVARQGLGEAGLRVMLSGALLNQTQEIKPDQTQPVLRRCFPEKDIRTVIAHYFDMYLVPGERALETPIHGAARSSAFRFKCKDTDVGTLACKLNVADAC